MDADEYLGLHGGDDGLWNEMCLNGSSVVRDTPRRAKRTLTSGSVEFRFSEPLSFPFQLGRPAVEALTWTAAKNRLWTSSRIYEDPELVQINKKQSG